ncbi:GumC family protein [Silvibacterium dinghuense]|uniref:Chain length determinant family protein n=1 Tax=Silvibacterium dinghuense TaxID=1560006 RepID=A0A4Q1SEH9_9BACT|nr:Wzz/FepE/Etk N-terminal domain-containing protein [Silvibacterium dinghuense]RXS95686.1 chain length determinant family protein [Silvibacterium dinghuense]
MKQSEDYQILSTATQYREERDVSLIDVLIVIARRKRLILGTAFAAASVGTVIALLLPNQYTAETLLLPPSQNSSMATTLTNQVGASSLASLAGGSLSLKNPGELYVSLLHTRTVEDAVIQQFGLMARYKVKHEVDARKVLESHAVISLGVKDGLIRIAVTDRDPKIAATIANGYVAEFRNLSANLAITEAAQRRKFFQQQFEDAKNNLANAEVALKNTEQSTGILQVDSQAKALIESAAALRAQITAKQVQLQGLRAYGTENNPAVITATNELEALQEQLAKLGGSQADAGGGLIIPQGKVPQAGMEYIRKYRDVKYYETIFELLARQLEVAKLDEAREGALIQVADSAVPPDKKSAPSRSMIVVLTFLAGAIISSLFALVQAAIHSANATRRMQLDLLFNALSLSKRK